MTVRSCNRFSEDIRCCEVLWNVVKSGVKSNPGQGVHTCGFLEDTSVSETRSQWHFIGPSALKSQRLSDSALRKAVLPKSRSSENMSDSEFAKT